MSRKFAFLLLFTVLFAAMGAYAQSTVAELAWGAAPCATPSSGTVFADVNTDGSGNYSYNPFGGNLQPGQYAIYAYEQGFPATFACSVETWTPPTAVTINLAPNPAPGGTGITVSGTISNPQPAAPAKAGSTAKK